MNTATLQAFRDITAIMQGSEPQTWQWTGTHMSQRMVNISERRATEYARLYGGIAVRMNSQS